MGCGTSRELEHPPALELDSDATCIMCLECVEDDTDVVQVSVTDNANKRASDEDDTTDSGSSDGTAAPSKVLVRQDKDGGPWINPDCGHACHLACLRGRCQAAHTGGPAERLTFGHLTCAICRSDFNITNRHAAITNQQRGAKTLEKLMKHDIATRDECTRILRKHARESPIDKIDGIDAMSEEAADALIARKIGAFRCVWTSSREGIECGADHAPKRRSSASRAPSARARRRTTPSARSRFTSAICAAALPNTAAPTITSARSTTPRARRLWKSARAAPSARSASITRRMRTSEGGLPSAAIAAGVRVY